MTDETTRLLNEERGAWLQRRADLARRMGEELAYLYLHDAAWQSLARGMSNQEAMEEAKDNLIDFNTMLTEHFRTTLKLIASMQERDRGRYEPATVAEAQAGPDRGDGEGLLPVAS